MRQIFGLIAGILLFVVMLLLPIGEQPQVRRMAAVAALMAAWWITEAIPLAATSLMPLVLMPLLKISPPDAVARSYMNDYIFLFIGGFTIALAMERWNLHRRLALRILHRFGDRPPRLVLGFMLASAFLSMWISNTATTMMMVPLALAVVALIREAGRAGSRPPCPSLPLVLMLSIAYASSIGGIATLIGTPPNVVFASRYHSEFPEAPEISFSRWLLIGLPFSSSFLIVAWLLLVRVLYPLAGAPVLGGRTAIASKLAELGPRTPAETRVLIVFLAAAFLWITRAEIPLGFELAGVHIERIPGWANLFGLVDRRGAWASDGTVAMMAALSLFFIPAGHPTGERLVDWRTVEKLPWNVLFLFGGGFALADGFVISGLSEYIGQRMTAFGQLPVAGQIIAVAATVTFLTELTSNTAIANLMMPILAGLARAIQMNPLALMLPAAISASCAFMLPVATPPNAIAFGTGMVPMRAMLRAGLLLNLVGIVLVFLVVYFIALPLWQANPTPNPAP